MAVVRNVEEIINLHKMIATFFLKRWRDYWSYDIIIHIWRCEMLAHIILTNDKTINLELYPEMAPKSVANFVKLAKSGYYKGIIFHRIIKDFMIQTGGYRIVDGALEESRDVPSIKGEFASNGFHTNTLKHELGVISMARTSVPDSASSQFFLCAGTATWLDGEYAAFGKTIDEDSNKVILEVAEMPVGNIGGGFQHFPYEEIGLKDIIIEDN